eukprot:TRINITY_DN5440_c0_g1_i1.p1 TRINITY_DN5440_c0_g1~~TRINITY_DN5440_c0_g1_i1.p1  ORF type:complete len:961 (+),score=321.92 TRINITY_DN5440_c0_g1_i1:89-2884(+)
MMCNALRVVLLACMMASTGGETVLEYLQSRDQLSIFLGWLKQTEEVMEHLEKGKGPYTIFVPKNSAVKEFLVSGVQGILEKDEEAIRKLVGYHIVTAADYIRPEDVPAAYAGMASTLYDGKKILLEQRGNTVVINGQSEITQINVGPSTGQVAMVHIVDRVLSYPGWFPTEPLLSIIHKKDNLRAFYVTVWEFKEELGLTQPGPISLFVPTNKAMARAGLGLHGTRLSTLLAKDRDQVLRILKYHIVHGKYVSPDDLAVPGVVQTLDVHDGKASLLAYQKDASGAIDLNNGEGKVETRKGSIQPAQDGILYAIDRLLLPPGLEVPDVNYSTTRMIALKEEEKAASITPEPVAVPFPIASPQQAPKSRRSPLVLVLLLCLTALLIYKVVMPDSTAPLSSSKKDDNARRDSAQPKQRPNYALAFALLLAMGVPFFPSTNWLLPSGIRSAADALTQTVSGGAAVRHDGAYSPSEAAAAAAENERQLDDLLQYVRVSIYKEKLVSYGLDRVDLIAMSGPDDGIAARVSPGHWNEILKEARKRHPVSPDELDPTPPPSDENQVRPSIPEKTVEDKERSEAERIAKEFADQSKQTIVDGGNEVDHMGGVPTPPPTAKPPVVAAVDEKKKYVLALISIPSTGASTVECTFGDRHGSFAFKNTEQNKDIVFTRIRTFDEAAALKQEFGRKGPFKEVAPDAKIVTTMVATRPLARFVRSFYKSVGKVNTAESDFRCKGRLKDKMRGQGKKFTLEDYVKLPPEARSQCESANNPMVKALAGVPVDQAATEQDVVKAKQNLQKLDMLMIEEDLEKKSAMGLMVLLGLTSGTYLSCSPYEDQAELEWSHRATDTIARDNLFDRQLYSEAHHVFNTKYAGGLEQSLDASKITCTKPQACFDENDRNGEKKAKDLFENVQNTMRRATSRQGVMCASLCHMPPPSA